MYPNARDFNILERSTKTILEVTSSDWISAPLSLYN